jgi:hypothetical protein
MGITEGEDGIKGSLIFEFSVGRIVHSMIVTNRERFFCVSRSDTICRLGGFAQLDLQK